MTGVMSVKEAALRWKMKESQVTRLCRAGRVAGAKMEGHRWLIPKEAERPVDGRKLRGGIYAEGMPLPLPVGISDFREATLNYYYVDKTLLIKDIIDELPKVTLFTRPRRFGKTLNMDMLRTFFEMSSEDTSVLFRDKNIWRCGEKYRAYQGKYPVIFLSFKDVKHDSWNDSLENIRFLIANEFQRHAEVEASDKCGALELGIYRRVVDGNATETELMNALLVLSQMLDAHYGIAPIIIIDEYDAPIEHGHMRGFYDEVIGFMRNLFSGAFKDNKHLSYGFMTGILKVAKESIFSGLNNLNIGGVLDKKYSEYFGFTEDEVRAMARYYNAYGKVDEIKKWYNGYRFGGTEIYNPWSIVNYFSNRCIPRAFWLSTGSNEILGEILTGANEKLYDQLCDLLKGDQSISSYIDLDVTYASITDSPSSIFSFLLSAGYLRPESSELSLYDGYMCELSLPNREIQFAYKKEILGKLERNFPQAASISIQEALFSGNSEALRDGLSAILMNSASFCDTSGEPFYHGFVLGLTALMDEKYKVKECGSTEKGRYIVSSNRESGYGRYDLELEPRDTAYPGILIELKAEKTAGEEKLRELANRALLQIEEKEYDRNMKSRGIEKIIKYGVAFSGKNAEVAVSM